jgi:hypothetical protein
LEFFKKEAEKSSNAKQYQFWRHDNKPIELWRNKVIQQEIDYVHDNPIEEGLVYKAEDYVYSSGIDYSGQKALIDDIVVFIMFNDNESHERIRVSFGTAGVRSKIVKYLISCKTEN